ncbi:hypothetical protein GL218_02015 [Daldinia childiae]|uniref:uncharacterized protein n=1 Tax=Daldinia childiae TaxID=326645 RepID=UPI001446CFB1|nr:uncharacterized protein GL218_02015 [Daldinia childiae]KAF3064257.1 hypothetical protein GL218_02015 [Daldinia childiae]
MDRRQSIVTDKTARSSGPVHRPSDPSGASRGSLPAGELSTDISTELSVGDDTGNASHQPPPYSSPSDTFQDLQARLQLPKGPQYYPGLPILDYRQYLPPLFDLSPDSITITSKANYLSENAGALATLVRSLATVPPKPQIIIQGNRGRKLDFSIKLNLMNLLVPNDPKDRLDYLRCVSKDEVALRGGSDPGLKPDFGADNGLEAWCDRFVKDSTTIKSFTVERVVANFDTNWLEGQVRSLVASTDYKGQVTVQFLITHAKVIIQNPDKHNKFLTSVTSLFSSKSKYEVVKAVWPFATSKNGEQGRKCVVQSEKTWWEEWRDPIRFAIGTKRQGWVTNEDKLECIMEGRGKGIKLIDWGSEFD